jgi:protein pelota
MKIEKKELESDNSGYIKLKPENEEDLWHIFNVVNKGDRINSTTIR